MQRKNKKKRMHKRKKFLNKKRESRKWSRKRNNKKGISVMVGYVLLIVFAIIIGGIVFLWLKTYVPRQALECPDGTCIFIKEASFDSDTSQLIVTLKNKGRFNLTGYFIHIKNNSEQELAIIDLSEYLNESKGGMIFGKSVLFAESGENLFGPGSETTHYFDIPDAMGELYSVRIIPTRFQDVEGRSRFVSCSNAITEQIVGEPVVCVPNTCESLGYVCGSWSDGCGGIIECPPGCTSPNVCDSNGQCVAPGECHDTCADPYGYECGTWDICGISTVCGSYGGGCQSGYTCNVEGQCVSLMGNGICDAGETCADADCEGEQNGCAENYICEGGSCVLDTSGVSSCPAYCVSLGYSTGSCQNSQACPQGGVYQSGGDQWCTGGGPNADTCCCQRIVFVSSSTYNGNYEGISGADTICNNLASSANLQGTFVAWLSDSTVNAKDRIPDAPYKRPDGVMVANNKADLLDGSLINEIDITESVVDIGAPDEVWTGTKSDGTTNAQNCNNWQSSSSSVQGYVGNKQKKDSKWTANTQKNCNNNYRLYCFQVS